MAPVLSVDLRGDYGRRDGRTRRALLYRFNRERPILCCDSIFRCESENLALEEDFICDGWTRGPQQL